MTYIEFLQQRAFSEGYTQRMFDEKGENDGMENTTPSTFQSRNSRSHDLIGTGLVGGGVAGLGYGAGKFANGYNTINAKQEDALNKLSRKKSAIEASLKEELSGIEKANHGRLLGKTQQQRYQDEVDKINKKYNKQLQGVERAKGTYLEEFKNMKKGVLKQAGLTAAIGATALGAGLYLKHRGEKQRQNAALNQQQ